MFFVIHACEMQKCEHIAADVFAFFPYHTDLYVDGRVQGNAGDAGTGKFIGHAGIKKAAVFSFYVLPKYL